jgi:hypothetical protein
MSTDYILFDRALCERLVAFIAERGISAEVRPDAIEGFVIAVPEACDERLELEISAAYDALMEEQYDLVAAEDGGSRTLMAVTVTIPSGESRLVALPGALGRRLHEHFTLEEVQVLIEEIAAAVANPRAGPLCRK